MILYPSTNIRYNPTVTTNQLKQVYRNFENLTTIIMQFTLLSILALASTTIAVPFSMDSAGIARPATYNSTTIARNTVPIDLSSILEKLPGLVAALQEQQGGAAATNATATAGASSGIAARQVDVAGILEQLPGVIGALKGGKGGNSTASPAPPTPGAGSAASGGNLASSLRSCLVLLELSRVKVLVMRLLLPLVLLPVLLALPCRSNGYIHVSRIECWDDLNVETAVELLSELCLSLKLSNTTCLVACP